MIIYLLRNIVNGKCYVGKTTRTLKARWRQHKTEARIGRHNLPLYQDIREFGEAAFATEVLGVAKDQRRLNQMERTFIRKLNTVEGGYNQACSSFGGRTRKPTRSARGPLPEAHRLKIAESVRKAWAHAAPQSKAA